MSAKRHVPCVRSRTFGFLGQSVGFKSVVVHKYVESRAQNRFAGFCRNGFPVLCKDSESRQKTETCSRFSEADPIFCKDIKITLKSGVYFLFFVRILYCLWKSMVCRWPEFGYMRCGVRSVVFAQNCPKSIKMRKVKKYGR